MVYYDFGPDEKLNPGWFAETFGSVPGWWDVSFNDVTKDENAPVKWELQTTPEQDKAVLDALEDHRLNQPDSYSTFYNNCYALPLRIINDALAQQAANDTTGAAGDRAPFVSGHLSNGAPFVSFIQEAGFTGPTFSGMGGYRGGYGGYFDAGGSFNGVLPGVGVSGPFFYGDFAGLASQNATSQALAFADQDVTYSGPGEPIEFEGRRHPFGGDLKRAVGW